MVFPRRLVHSLRELHKDDEILRAQIERPVRPAKIKAPLRLEFALGVFTHVTPSFAVRAVCPYTFDRAIAHAPSPCLALLMCLLRRPRRGAAGGALEFLIALRVALPNGDQDIDMFDHRAREVVRMQCHEHHAVHRVGHHQASRLPLARPEMMGLVDHDPVRPAIGRPHRHELREERGEHRRPHWIMVDEAHHLWPSEWEAGRLVVPDAVHGMVFVTLHPDHLAGAVIKHINVLIAIGESPAERYEEFERATGSAAPRPPQEALEQGEAWWWRVGDGAVERIRTHGSTAPS